MSYRHFSDEQHFINTLKKRLRESPYPIDKSQLLPEGFYIKHIYNTGLAEKLSWKVRCDPRILEQRNLLEWLKTAKNNGISLPPQLEHRFSRELIELLDDLVDVSGVYSFWNEFDDILYVGMSIDLSSRIISSFSNKLNQYDKHVFLRYIATKTASDAYLIEAYFIGKLKPPLNGLGCFQDDLTIELINPPELSKPIKMSEPITPPNNGLHRTGESVQDEQGLPNSK